MNCDALIDLALEAGRRLLENGAETYRVEDSITRILLAYGAGEAEVFAIPSCIIVTIRAETDGAPDSYTRMRRILARSTNLDRISRLNDVCRRICREKPGCEGALAEVNAAAHSPAYCFGVQLAACALISFSFTLFFGGDIFDALCAIACGIGLKLTSAALERFRANWFFANILESGVVAAMAFAAVALGLCGHSDKIIIGTLMNLVPGVALTNSMRDIIAGDLLAGLIKLVEALMIAAAIALGSGVVLYGLRLF